MKVRSCKKCFAHCGYYPEWINGSPYCPPCAEAKKTQLKKGNLI